MRETDGYGGRGGERREDERTDHCTHCALMWLLPSVTSHVNEEHVLSFEWLLCSHTSAPLADELLLAVPNRQREQGG